MDISKYGKRYRCYACGALFYDLNKEKAICPKCGADQANAPKPEPQHAPAELAEKDTEDLDLVDDTLSEEEPIEE